MATLVIDEKSKKGTINKEIYGHFAEHLGRGIYEGLFVKEDSGIPNIHGIRCDVLEALKEIKVPVIRWPGGCYADGYHWKEGIGPLSERTRIVNTYWGDAVEDNSFGTHEFFELCELLGCEAYINGNIGTGTVREMQEWFEYITGEGDSPMSRLRRQNGRENPWRMKFFGFGNESWGCGGNMRPEYYADLFRHYQTFMVDSQKEKAKKIAVGPCDFNYEWTKRLLAACYDMQAYQAHGYMDGFSLHYYTLVNGFGDKRSATNFDEKEWYMSMNKANEMDTILTKNEAIMDVYDPEKKLSIIVDEWGNWFDPEPGSHPGFLYQQNTMRDAVTAGLTLNIFNKHCDRVSMANIAQMINVLQAVLLTDGKKMIKTPTYYAFDLYKVHQDCTLLESTIDTEIIGDGKDIVPNLSESVSIDDKNDIHVTISNQSFDTAYPVRLEMKCGTKIKSIAGKILQGKPLDYNTFENPDCVKLEDYKDYTVDNGEIVFNVPAASILMVELKI